MVTTRDLNDLAGDRFDRLNEGFSGAATVCLVIGDNATNNVGVCLTNGWPKRELARLLRDIADRVEGDANA